MKDPMTSDELLQVCQAHFPALPWEIEFAGTTEPEGAIADIHNGNGIILLSLYPKGAIASFDQRGCSLRSDNLAGITPDEALTQLKGKMLAYAEVILGLLGDEQ